MQIQYRIRANKPPLLIKPPPIQNSYKPPLFCLKVHFLGLFWGKFWKNFNKPPPQKLDFFIGRQRFIDTDTVRRNMYILVISFIHSILYSKYISKGPTSNSGTPHVKKC